MQIGGSTFQSPIQPRILGILWVVEAQEIESLSGSLLLCVATNPFVALFRSPPFESPFLIFHF